MTKWVQYLFSVDETLCVHAHIYAFKLASAGDGVVSHDKTELKNYKEGENLYSYWQSSEPLGIEKVLKNGKFIRLCYTLSHCTHLPLDIYP